MLKPVALLALSAFLLGGCSSLPTGPTSELEFGPNHPKVRPALVPFDPGEPPDIVESIIVPLPPARSLATGRDPLVDDGRHLRVRLMLGAEGAAQIESVTVGAGTARAYLSDSQDLVVSLLGKGGERLASIDVRQPLVEHVYRGRVGKSVREGADSGGSHGTRMLNSALLTVFLPSIDGAEKVEVRLAGEKGRIAAEYKIQ